LRITSRKFAEPICVGLSTESGVLALHFGAAVYVEVQRPLVDACTVQHPER
jgi:hypothetical protein